jgi:hypothetical protein
LSNIAYSLDNVTYTQLPGYYMIGGRPNSKEESNILHETGNGVKFTYNMWSKDVRELIFHILESDIHVWEDFHGLVNGEQFPFYLSMLGTGIDAIYVYKEPGFDPKELEKTKHGILFEYIMTVKSALT